MEKHFIKWRVVKQPAILHLNTLANSEIAITTITTAAALASNLPFSPFASMQRSLLHIFTVSAS